MLKIKNSILIQVSTEKVFAFLAVPENLPLWNYYLITVNKISTGKPVIGSQYHQVRKKDEQYFEITGFEENKLIEFTSTRPSLIQFKRKMFFSSTNNGCTIDDVFELKSIVPSFLLRLLTKNIQKAVNENLGKLKQLLQTGTTTLQDGRIVNLNYLSQEGLG